MTRIIRQSSDWWEKVGYVFHGYYLERFDLLTNDAIFF